MGRTDDRIPGELPPPHERFAQHFTRTIYEVGRAQNDELPPFGTDEGSDEVHEWGSRLVELRANPTLRYMIGQDADQVASQLRSSPTPDLDDVLIALGFTLLRFAGQIDYEGKDWLLEALRRRGRDSPKHEYADLLSDLNAFSDVGRSRPSGGDEGRWLSIRIGGGDSSIERWCRRLSTDLMTDEAWNAWWAATDIDKLTLFPALIGPRRDFVDVERVGHRLEVAGSSVQLTKLVHGQNAKIVTSRDPDQQPLAKVPGVLDALQELISHLLSEAGTYLGLNPHPRIPERRQT